MMQPLRNPLVLSVTHEFKISKMDFSLKMRCLLCEKHLINMRAGINLREKL